jgi:predicted RNase H-like HicB family nuclease
MRVTVEPIQKLTLRFRAIVEPDDGGFHAYCPAFKGLHVDGATQKDALRNLAEAASAYLNSLAAHQEPLPIGPDCALDEEEQGLQIPPGALSEYLDLQWPSQKESGTN